VKREHGIDLEIGERGTGRRSDSELVETNTNGIARIVGGKRAKGGGIIGMDEKIGFSQKVLFAKDIEKDFSLFPGELNVLGVGKVSEGAFQFQLGS
jgi:hypothetical protein